MTPDKFVFVVCGSREHIETLHFSLRYLEHFSKNEIVVVTDSLRNEIPVLFKNVLDITTPEHFTNHQASIYLKTGLHRFLPSGFNYCYLDTDVIALNSDCDSIFNHKQAVISFAADHCKMPRFSPYAVKCGCLEKNKQEVAELEMLLEKYDVTRKQGDPIMTKKMQELIKKFEIIKQDKLKYFFITLRFLITFRVFKLDDDTYYHRWEKLWRDKEGRIIIRPAENMFKGIEKVSQWRWNSFKRRWSGPGRKDVFNLECPHLAEFIFNRFQIEIKDKNFQHWNGGVFVFNDSSHPFMEAWFDKTMKIFTYPDWVTRDQGTLIATVWQFGLQNKPLLSQQFNFIADWYNPKMMMDDDGNFTTDAFKTKLQPAFIHIYHNFGKTGWETWDYVVNLGKREGIL